MNKTSYHAVIDLGNEYHISEINLHDMHNTQDFTIEYIDESNWATLFTDPCNTFNTWSKNETDVTTRFLRVSMYNGTYASVNEIIIYGFPVTKESEQIVITPNMVSDLVPGGSVNSPLLLFDEQNLDFKAEEHPTSNSWKPYYTSANTPYYTVIDLGQEYYISEINLHDMHDTQNFTVEYGEPNNWSSLFIDPLDKFKVWNKHITDISTRYLRLSLTESPFAAVNEIIIYGYPILDVLNIIEEEPIDEGRIIINADMVTDLVEGGSVNSPLLLFDEQNLNFLLGEHPTSNSWKPAYAMNNGSYHVLVDLGTAHHISEIKLHDMHNTYNFTVAYGDESNWTTLFVDPCDRFNTWSKNTTDVSTRYLRFSMNENVFAAVNEIFIYGYPINSKSENSAKSKKTEHITSIEPVFNSDKIKLYPNPVNDKLNVTFPVHLLGKSNLVIRNVIGKVFYNKEIIMDTENPILELNDSQLPKTDGMYMLSLLHESGELKTLKFIRKH